MAHSVESLTAAAPEVTRIAASGPHGLFPYSRWHALLPSLARSYRERQPFPHAHLVEFFEPEIAVRIADEFPSATSQEWVHWKHFNENKLGLTKRALFPPFIGQVVDELNAPPFVAWLSQLTGIEGLVADPGLDGGGLHQSGAGGYLNVHTDFTTHHHQPAWRRRVNLILYLNRNWNDAWGGAIELWDRDMRGCVVRIPPLFNHAVIFNTEQPSYHGFPEPLRCPAGVTRRSLALYYYTVEKTAPVARSTDYRPRPSDGFATRAMIWADKKILHLYSRLKSRLGLSDDFASATLRLLHRMTRVGRNRDHY